MHPEHERDGTYLDWDDDESDDVSDDDDCQMKSFRLSDSHENEFEEENENDFTCEAG